MSVQSTWLLILSGLVPKPMFSNMLFQSLKKGYLFSLQQVSSMRSKSHACASSTWLLGKAWKHTFLFQESHGWTFNDCEFQDGGTWTKSWCWCHLRVCCLKPHTCCTPPTWCLFFKKFQRFFEKGDD